MAKRQDDRSERIRSLRDRAAQALEKGRPEKAVEDYLELEQIDPNDPTWAKRAADCYLRLRQPAQQVAALARAADGYARTGFALKAIALSKLISSIDPGHGLPEALLAGLPKAPAVVEVGAGVAPVHDQRTRSIPPGAPLESAALREIVPAPRVTTKVEDPGIHELALDDVEFLPDDALVLDDDAERARELAHRILPRTPLFSEVSARTLENLVEHLTLRHLAPGEVLFHAGEPADAMYVIAEGVVEIRCEDRTPVAMLGEGEFFGELGIVAELPRTHTVAGVEAAQLLALERTTLSDLVEAEPSFLRTLLRFVRERLVSRLTATNPLFAPFSPAERAELVGRFRFLEALPEAVLVREGEKGQGLFVLLSGRAEVLRGRDSIGQLESGDVFGELSLLSQEPAMATVRVTRKAFVLLMPTQSFLNAAMAHPHILFYTSELARKRQAENATRLPPKRIGADRRLRLP
jgi:CRP-like cAMP-binding protein